MNLKNLNRSTKSNVITFGIVIGFYLLLLGIDCIIAACSKLGAR